MWRAGEIIVGRNIWHGQVRNAEPLRVLVDDEAQTVLWHPEGARWRAPPATAFPYPGEPIAEHVSDDALILIHRPGEYHSVHVGRRNGEHYAWYVNFETPRMRTATPFDSRDLFLDIWVNPDRSWRLLDEDELEHAYDVGLVTDADVASVRADAESVIERIDHWESPLCH